MKVNTSRPCRGGYAPQFHGKNIYVCCGFALLLMTWGLLFISVFPGNTPPLGAGFCSFCKGNGGGRLFSPKGILGKRGGCGGRNGYRAGVAVPPAGSDREGPPINRGAASDPFAVLCRSCSCEAPPGHRVPGSPWQAVFVDTNAMLARTRRQRLLVAFCGCFAVDTKGEYPGRIQGKIWACGGPEAAKRRQTGVESALNQG